MAQVHGISAQGARDRLDRLKVRPLEQSIHYSGRKTVRAKSEQRRLRILEATLRIAAKEGIRGIKHRPVAREAGVPLASTTYYFRDIQELIGDAFMLFAEKARGNLDRFYDTINLVLDNAPQEALRRGGPGRVVLARRLAAISSAYLTDQFLYRREEVLAEQVFLMEALRDEHLAGLAQSYRQAWIAGLEKLLRRLDSPAPGRDAALLVSVVLGMGYDILLYGDQFRRARVSETVERVVKLVLAAD